MELNELIGKKLTAEQKYKFQRDNGKMRLINNIVIIPIVTAIIGIYLESILIVSVSVFCIIAFLILLAYNALNKKNTVYDNVIIPLVLNEKFNKIEYIGEDDSVIDEFNNSQLVEDYNKIRCSNYFKINEDKYTINIAKVTTDKLNIEENDGVVDKDLEQNFSGIFAYTKLPNKFSSEFKVIENEKNILDVNTVDTTNTELIKMNNIGFDSKYDVYSMNQVSIKKILTPGAMERILDIDKNINATINFSVYDSKLYIAIRYEKFMDFKSHKKEYVIEEEAEENLNALELLNYFVRYFVNIAESEQK